MNTNNDYKKLATRYFEGSISFEEEHTLFTFIRASDENAQLFHQWKQTWRQTHIPSADVLTSLSRLNREIDRNEKSIRNRSWLRFSAVAAAVMALLFVSIHVFRVKMPEATESYLSVQVPLGTNRQILLPDGTLVWLNAGSVFKYKTDFNTTSRDVSLIGEAYFEVAKNKALPFRVTTQQCTFTVLGTKFNITAYDDDPNILAVLMEGSLRFESDTDHETMTPGDLITYDCNTKLANRTQVDADQFRAWIDGTIRYNAISLPALFRRLSREYDVEIELCTSAFNNKIFSISLTNAENIDQVMHSLVEILPIAVKRQGRHFYVMAETE